MRGIANLGRPLTAFPH